MARAPVALRKESVDRNTNSSIVNVAAGVALRKESVDRNVAYLATSARLPASLSARRAWIEIFAPLASLQWVDVALRKESVDRN